MPDTFNVRRASTEDLPTLVKFTAEEAREAEGSSLTPETLRKGIEAALNDTSLAMYWVMFDEKAKVIGSVSAIREWSDWNAGFYWWIQSMYLLPEARGKGLMGKLIETVNEEMKIHGGLELRLYVHADNIVASKAYEKVGFEYSSYQIMTLQQ
ncbi:GNAT family N-acetyltransferase [Grimontia sp. S25]|uniref:GNAT family N-acetyltransferase n=2 Tax=Grimontia sedimenti TaxID=2711294 RepID=A0A6M1R884_9GAMM|nr:GNAT family N-acetyltransferase [Grimontia sedimenti]